MTSMSGSKAQTSGVLTDLSRRNSSCTNVLAQVWPGWVAIEDVLVIDTPGGDCETDKRRIYLHFQQTEPLVVLLRRYGTRVTNQNTTSATLSER